MSNEGDAMKVEIPAEVVQEVAEEVEAPVEETVETVEPSEKEPESNDNEVEEAQSDLVKDAMTQNEQLKKELEELRESNTDVFEQNEMLKKELEDQKKLLEIAKQNEELKGRLEAMKRDTIVESLIKSGRITNDLKEWAQNLEFDALQQFADKAPKAKTILEEENDPTQPSKDMQEWHDKMMKSRIIS